MATPTTQQADTRSTNGNTKPKKARKPRDLNAPVSAIEYAERVKKNRDTEAALLQRVPASERSLAGRMVAALAEPEQKPAA